MGRPRASEHPADRLRRTARRPQHRHAHHRLDRPGHQAGRDVQPAARHGRRAGARPDPPSASGAASYRSKINSLVRGEPAPVGPVARQRPARVATTRSRRSSASCTTSTSATSSRSTSTASRRSSTPSAGVTINVQVPVVDDQFPGTTGRAQRLYIPSGLQHMDGEQALRYARSRHTSTDFDRGARQQRVLLSLREQADPQTLIPRLPELVAALKTAVRTDIPIDQLDELLGLASQVDTANIRSYVFAPPLYSQRHLPGRPRLRRDPEHRPDQAGGEERIHRRPARRGPAPDARRRGRPCLGPQRHDDHESRRARWPATSSTTAWLPRRRAASRRARCRPRR